MEVKGKKDTAMRQQTVEKRGRQVRQQHRREKEAPNDSDVRNASWSHWWLIFRSLPCIANYKRWMLWSASLSKFSAVRTSGCRGGGFAVGEKRGMADRGPSSLHCGDRESEYE